MHLRNGRVEEAHRSGVVADLPPHAIEEARHAEHWGDIQTARGWIDQVRHGGGGMLVDLECCSAEGQQYGMRAT